MPTALRPIALTLRRFWAKVDRRGPDECWPWLAVTDVSGYGKFSIDGRSVMAHRLSWALANKRSMPADLEACHSCDGRYTAGDISYRRCCNPRHVFSGTRAQNQADMVAKGRQAMGAQFRRSALTADVIREIRRVYHVGSRTCGARPLGRKYGVSHTAIRYIVTRRNWRVAA